MSGGPRAFAMSMGVTRTNKGSSQLPCSGVTDSWTVHGYARVSRGRNDGTDTLQNQRLRLAGDDDVHIHQDIITGTVSQRPGLNGLLDAIQAGDVLNQSQGGMYIEVAMMISWVMPVNPSHPYLENDPAPSFDPHHLRISPWL